MHASRSYDVPPGSTAEREILHSIGQALEIPAPARADDPEYLRLAAERMRHTRAVIRTILASPACEHDDRDLMVFAVRLREEVKTMPAVYSVHRP
jgi:hypothetical protein